MKTCDVDIIAETDFGLLVRTQDGSLTIRHPIHSQDFHSTEGARFEAWELYVVASGFLERLAEPGHIAVLDVGMGLGYNACATIAAWFDGPGSAELSILSLEIESALVLAVASGKAPWMEGWGMSWLMGPQCLQSSGLQWEANVCHPKTNKSLRWIIELGDANRLNLAEIRLPFDFVWQDPFTPELNPNMWSSAWFDRLLKISSPTAKLMTYRVSRVVRDALIAGGWSAERFPSAGKKRHWLRAQPRSLEVRPS